MTIRLKKIVIDFRSCFIFLIEFKITVSCDSLILFDNLTDLYMMQLLTAVEFSYLTTKVVNTKFTNNQKELAIMKRTYCYLFFSLIRFQRQRLVLKSLFCCMLFYKLVCLLNNSLQRCGLYPHLLSKLSVAR